MLASILKSLSQAPATRNIPILRFFCKDGSGTTGSPYAIIRNLVSQILDQKQFCEKHLTILNDARIKDPNLYATFPNTLWPLFLDMIKLMGTPVFVVIDALDECSDSGQILARVQGLLGEGGHTFRLLIASRHDPKFSNLGGPSYSSLRIAIIHLNGPEVNDGIKAFVTTQAHKIDYLEGFEQVIIPKICEKSAGMFRYAALALENIQRSPKPIVEALDDLPEGLKGMYEKILLELPAKDLELRRLVLQWVALAAEPLSVQDIFFAFITRELEDKFDPSQHRNPFTKDEIVNACSQLIDIADDGKLRFTHLSVKEFLLERGSTLNKTVDQKVISYMISPVDVHKSMAARCGRFGLITFNYIHLWCLTKATIFFSSYAN